jgi:hypothetical protein
MLREFTLIALICPKVLGAAFEHFGLYEGIGPQGVEQFFACNQPAGVFHQIIQEANAFGVNRVRSSFSSPRPAHRALVYIIQLEWTKLLPLGPLIGCDGLSSHAADSCDSRFYRTQ